MEINLTIGWDDLSKECKEKIKQLQKLVGKNCLNITYPPINQFVGTPRPYDINYGFDYNKVICAHADESATCENKSES